jgi:NMD protein affecting ribosome stability and mRNA decay
MRIVCSRCGRVWTGGDWSDAGWKKKGEEVVCYKCSVRKPLFEVYAALDPPMSENEMQALNQRLMENL